jgi:quercetin dioxygenase-like cupin family protein
LILTNNDMPILLAEKAHITTVKEGVKRRLIHTDGLMTVVIDFDNGPWEQPDPPHSHVHEQTTYIAEGEIIFFCEGEPDQRLKAGDMFSVYSGKEHAIQLLSKTARLVDSFTPPREDFL